MKPDKECSSDKRTLLEINLISAQGLPTPRLFYQRTYVVAYIHPEHRLVSRVSGPGDGNPTWNDKFLFLINSELEVKRPNCCMVFEIYSSRRFRRDKKIGKAHVRLENLLKSAREGCGDESDDIHVSSLGFYVHCHKDGPGGILNIGVVTLDGDLSRNLSGFLSEDSQIDYRRLMGGDNQSLRGCSCVPTFKTRSTLGYYKRLN